MDEDDEEKGYIFKRDWLEIYYLPESKSFKKIDPYDSNEFFSDMVYTFNESIFAINSRIHK